MGLYLSLSVYACSCLFSSVAVCFLHFLFVFYLLRIEHIISIISFLFIIWIMISSSSTYNISFTYSLHFLYNNTRVTCSSALSGHPSSSFCGVARRGEDGERCGGHVWTFVAVSGAVDPGRGMGLWVYGFMGLWVYGFMGYGWSWVYLTELWKMRKMREKWPVHSWFLPIWRWSFSMSQTVKWAIRPSNWWVFSWHKLWFHMALFLLWPTGMELQLL